MQTIIGRLAADATIGTTKQGRQVVNFTIVENTRFKPKNSETVKTITTFYKCAYWLSAGIAEHLRKGRLIETTGRIGSKAWQSATGKPKSELTLNVSAIKLHDKAAASTAAEAPTVSTAKSDDLPF